MDKILVAEPIYNAMPPAVYNNRIYFWKMAERDACAGLYRANPVELGPRRGIRSARQVAIRIAIDVKATHLLFLDDDVKVPPHILRELINVDAPIVGGLIHKDDGTPIVFQAVKIANQVNFPAFGESGFKLGPPIYGEVPWLDHPKAGAFECAAVGAGCMLIKIEVLETLLTSGRWWLFNYDETQRSMDVLFCRMAREAGFKVFCWPDVPCEQVKHY